MAYDEGLAERIREIIGSRGVVEKKMFGGLAFMVRGHMCCGVQGEELMLRVGPERFEETLAKPHARKMDFTGRPLKGFIYVDSEGLESDDDLAGWVQLGRDFVKSLPPK